MIKPCPYCATALCGGGMVTCRGCGNPVSLGAETREIAEAVQPSRWTQVEFWMPAPPASTARFFPFDSMKGVARARGESGDRIAALQGRAA